MKPTEKQKAEVRGYINKWQPKLFLHPWSFKVEYHDDETRQGLKINMHAEYKDAMIEVHMDFWRMDEHEREQAIIHELCHCIVQPLVELVARAAEGHGVSQREIDWNKEQVTQHLAIAIFN